MKRNNKLNQTLTKSTVYMNNSFTSSLFEKQVVARISLFFTMPG